VGQFVPELEGMRGGVRADLHYGYRAVMFRHRPQDRVGDAVVAPHRDRPASVGMNLVELLGNPVKRLFDLERRRAHIPVVGDADPFVDGDVVNRMVQADLARVVADRAGRQPGADAGAGDGGGRTGWRGHGSRWTLRPIWANPSGPGPWGGMPTSPHT